MLIVNFDKTKSHCLNFRTEDTPGVPDQRQLASNANNTKVVKLNKEEQAKKLQKPSRNPCLPVIGRVKNLAHNFIQSDHASPIGFSKENEKDFSPQARDLLKGCQKAVQAFSTIIGDRNDMSEEGIIFKFDAINFRNQIIDFLMKVTDGKPFGSTPPRATKANLNAAIIFESNLDVAMLRLDARAVGVKINIK